MPERQWEIFEKGKPGYGSKNQKWFQVPAVSIGKDYVSVNGPFLKEIMGQSTQVIPLYSDGNDHRILAFKVVPRGDEVPSGYNLRREKRGKSAKVASKQLATRLSDLRGRQFMAIRNPATNLIEVELSPSNQLT